MTIEKRSFGAEVAKVLKLMIHSLYTNKDIFLRELISNASDACDKLRYAAITEPGLVAGEAAFGIHITIDKKARTLTVSDNGIGMSRDELIEHLGTIAKSGTGEFLESLRRTDPHPNPLPQAGEGMNNLIGQFGVGFYSSFMVADKVSVISLKAGETQAHVWESDGLGEFTIAPAATAPRGTSVVLHLKEGEDEYLDMFRLRHIVQTYSDHISFPIIITDDEGKSETVNTASALWMRPKSEITEAQYKEFYHHVAHQPDAPWLTLHVKAEGKLEYTALLFIPTIKPFDLFHPDRKRRVKLYVKRVFITDEGVDLVPQYMRFLRGVVDSEDLPLNISRETLQHNPTLTKIREALVKRVLAELKKKTEDEKTFEIFWNNFGAVLKEGLCEAIAPRQEILEVCRFRSTQGDGWTGLDDYIARMKPEQKEIFTLAGDQLEALRDSPILEGFARRGIEVLLLTDHVDDFWLTVTSEYKGKPFKSVTRSDIDLNAIEKKETPPASDAMQPLIERCKKALGDKVKDVRLTHKLEGSPACLAVEEGAMDIRLERFLMEQKQLPTASAKILELNPAHPIIQKLEAMGESAESNDMIWMLFDQARLVEGETIDNPAAFSRRINAMMQKMLAA